MDVVFLVIDSLSFSSTPFAEDGPPTMPQFSALVKEHGISFTNAYAPGPLSPSSHASILTGELPSVTGMHEAYPYFDRDLPTLAERLSGSHATHLLSLNMWLFQGLNRGFEHERDFSRQYLAFREATDPKRYFEKHDPVGSWPRNLWEFMMYNGTPLRSLANYASYRWSDGSLVPSEWGDAETYQYADRFNDEIRQALSVDGDDAFVLANYMDIHPPFDASDEALERFVPDTPREALPIGISPERHIENDQKSYSVEDMQRLYHAVIWDFDRKFAPLIADLVADDAFVVVTSDHGLWNHDTAYAENRLHVPLVIFSPDHDPRTVAETVSLRTIPATITDAVTGNDGGFHGPSLLKVESDQVAETEIIHYPNEVYERTGRVDITKGGTPSADVQRDLVLVKDDARLDYIAGEWEPRRGTQAVIDELQAHGEEILSTPLKLHGSDIEFDATTERRLEDLGYL